MIEIWRDIKDYEGLYQVSNLGRVKSLGNGGTHKTSRILKSAKNTWGYLRVQLWKNGKGKWCFVHRLAATAFLDNPDNLPCVNHKDENPSNNFVGTPENDYKDGNIEWCSHEYNINYGTRNEKVSKVMTNGKLSKTVLQFTLDGLLVKEWSSTRECERNGFDNSAVGRCCNGKQKSHKGYIWKYKETL